MSNHIQTPTTDDSKRQATARPAPRCCQDDSGSGSQTEVDSVSGGGRSSSFDEASSGVATQSGGLSEAGSGSERHPYATTLRPRLVERPLGRWVLARDRRGDLVRSVSGRASFPWTIGGGGSEETVALATAQVSEVDQPRAARSQSIQETLCFFAGLRVLSMLWVFLGHLAVCYVIFHRHDTAISLLLEWFANSIRGNLIFGATYAVDSFFFISGVLTALSTARIFAGSKKTGAEGPAISGSSVPETAPGICSSRSVCLEDKRVLTTEAGNNESMKRSGSPPVVTICCRLMGLLIRRYFRLVGVILIYVLPPKIMAHLPRMQHSVSIVRDLEQGLLFGLQGGCYRFWWSNILLLNNIYPKYAFECAGWMWYIANDWQFFVFGSFLTILVLKRRRLGLIAVVASLLGSVSVAVYMAYKLRLTTALNIALTDWELAEGRPYPGEDPSKFFFWALATRFDPLYYFYMAPWVRVHSHLVGLLVGLWVLHRQLDPNRQPGVIAVNLKRLPALVLQLGAMACMLFLTLVPYSFGVSPKSSADLIRGAAYSGLGRLMWASALAILTVTAVQRPEANLLRWLGHSAWFFPSQLSYAFYHAHLTNILIFVVPLIVFFDITALSLWSFLLIVTIPVAIATFTSSIVVHYWVERPVQQLGIRVAKRIEALAIHAHSN